MDADFFDDLFAVDHAKKEKVAMENGVCYNTNILKCSLGIIIQPTLILWDFEFLLRMSCLL